MLCSSPLTEDWWESKRDEMNKSEAGHSRKLKAGEVSNSRLHLISYRQ